MSENDNSVEAKIERMQAARAERRAEVTRATNEQFVLDLEYIEELELEHGPNNVSVIKVPFDEAGVPVTVAVRTPKPAEVARYRDRLKVDKADTAKAAEELGAACRIYPDKDVLEKIVARRSVVKSQMGVVAMSLAVGTAEEEGKD